MAKPYYEDAAVKLYLGDAREILPQLDRVDLVLTDPPYGVEGGHGGQLSDYRKTDYLGEWEDTPEYINDVCVPIIQDCIKLARTVVLTPGSRRLCSYPQPDAVGGFYAPAASRIGRFGFQNLHPIFFYGHYKNAGKGALHTVRVLTETAEDNGHPCPKPLLAWKWLLDRCSEPGDLVLDPFAGSGTTLRAAKDLGRKAIGIEIEERYCEIAAKRMSQMVMQLG